MSELTDQWPNIDTTYSQGIICKNLMLTTESNIHHFEVGTFVQIHSEKENVSFCVVGNDMSVETQRFKCSRSDVIYVPDNLWGPLFTVNQGARLRLVKDSNLAQSIGNISVGDSVQVLGSDDKVLCSGIVTFRNSIIRLGVGVYFGLKIQASENNFQEILSISLLEPGTKGFPRGCDVVVGIDKIRPNNMNINKQSMNNYNTDIQKQFVNNIRAEEMNSISYKSAVLFNLNDKLSSKPVQKNEVSLHSEVNQSCKKTNLSDSSLSVGNRVVYLNNDKPEKGVVKWIGNIKNSLKVIEEFDNPVENGRGVFDEVESFKARNSYTLIVSPKTLIKLSDCTADNSSGTIQFQNNNYNNNNNFYNCNNNNHYNNIRLTDVCCGISSNEEKHAQSNSYPHLKQNENAIYDDSLQLNNDGIYTKQNCQNKLQNINDCNLQLPSQPSLRNIDFATTSERKQTYRRHCHSIDEEFMSLEGLKMSNNSHLYNNCSKKTSQNVVDSIRSIRTKQEKIHGSFLEEKFITNPDEDIFVNTGSLSSQIKDETPMHLEKDSWNSYYSEHSSSNENVSSICDISKPSASFTSDELGKGSVVELIFNEEPHYGVIRWIGLISDPKNNSSSCLFAGVEMEEEENSFTDGTFNNKRYFQCNPKKALFVPLSKCKKDSRFLDDSQKESSRSTVNYGHIDCPIVEGTIPPIRKGDIRSICGKNRGIQGHHNSCYLDATLFSMFAFTCVFDSLLYRPPTSQDIPQYSEVQRVLREEIVNPLRKNLYVRADRVMKLRTLLENLSSVSGLTSEEKDPEEFFNSLLAQILKAEPFLKLSSGQEAFHYQLFVEKDEKLTFPSVQQLLEQSFVTSDIKLKQVPPCLIIQMPRFGKSFKMYSKILPPQVLDVTDIIENSPRQCTVCGKLAEYECKDCFGQTGMGNGLESISYCRVCLGTAHNHHCRTRHNYKSLTVPIEFSVLQDHYIIPRLYMELFAVVCIETSHYVAFVKCGSGSDAPWCFFDSMADRKGEQNGYNIPEMVACPDLPYWLSEDGAKMLNEMRDERNLPEHAKRLFSDAYMCMYQSPDMMMYR